MNRILLAINETSLLITQNPKNSSPEKLEALRKALDMDFEEYANFQTLKSLASQDGTLTLEEAQTVYGYLGETPEHFNKQNLAVKITLTKLYQQLLGRQIAAHA